MPHDAQSFLSDAIRAIREDGISAELVALTERDVKARPFKLLRTSLERLMADNGYQSVGITSASPGAGKSFIASNLAASLSQLPGRDVVLVDLDLQRASIADLFGLEDTGGVIEYLSGETDDLASLGCRLPSTGLIVLPTFIRRTSSAELLASDRLGRLIEAVTAAPERPLAVCDLPPLFVSDDAMLAAQALDAILLVVEQGTTTKKQVEACYQLLYPTKILGTIFNRYAGGFTDPYGYYGGYGKYHQ